MLGLPMSFVFSGDSVEMLMYPAQAPPVSYRIRRDSVESRTGDVHRVQAFSIRSDTLRLAFGERIIVYRRLGSQPDARRPLVGTWRSVDGSTLSVLTFRSDSRLVLEIGAPTQMRLHGDTLNTFIGKETLRSVLTRSGDTIIVSPLPGDTPRPGVRPQTIVRRSWACFGIKALDASAAECQ